MLKFNFPSAKKLLYLAFFIVVLILGGEVVYYLRIKETRETKVTPTPVSSEQISPFSLAARAEAAGYRIIFQGNSHDTTGRTVLHEGRGERSDGAGAFPAVYKGAQDIWRLIGVFKGWEEIANSKDRYIKLYDPLEDRDLPLARVAFEESGLFKGRFYATSLAVANLDYGPENPAISPADKLGSVMDWEIKDLDRIFKPGDVILVTLVFGTEGEGILRDNEGKPLVGWLVIRRFGGKAQVEKELGEEVF